MIRPIVATDKAEWRRLWTAYLEFYKSSVPQAVYQASFARLIGQGAQDFHGLFAILDGVPVGLVHFVFHPHMWKVEGTCYLQDLYADPEVRGKGIGRSLIQAVYDAADSKGVPSVYWMTQEFNYTGRMLYDRIGVKTPFIKYDRPQA